MDSKQRADLRAKAQPLDVILTIGKNGVSDATIAEAAAAFNTHELLKSRVLETAPEDIKTCAEAVAEAAGAEIVHIIGNTFVLYKKLPEKAHVKPKPRKPVSNVKVRRRYASDTAVRVSRRSDNAETREGNRQGFQDKAKSRPTRPGKLQGKRPLSGKYKRGK
ncbi:MAG: YhbY family RNA-binding protein [Ruminococcus sp.]|jgi:RNA-binding protein|nr:YhbY family RNA-binding protein [Ruminococcus sp.]